MAEWMNERTNERMNESMNERTNEWTNERTNEWMNEYIYTVGHVQINILGNSFTGTRL